MTTTWPSIRFDLWREGQDLCVLTDQEAMATFRLEEVPVGPTGDLAVRLAVVVWT